MQVKRTVDVELRQLARSDTYAERLSRFDNDIADTMPLVNNLGIGRRTILLGVPDEVLLDGNPLSTQSVDEYLPSLRRRGVKINYTPPPGEEVSVVALSNRPTHQ